MRHYFLATSMDEQEALAVIRTLLAYERNYQSIERTQLAQFRTGLSLALITPPAAATLAYAFEFLPQNYLASVVVYVFLGLLVVYGVYMALSAFLGLRKTRKVQNKIRQRQKEVIAKSDAAKKLLDDLH
jgi:uncharacterized membrane protein YidH (DUF202 family)